MTQISLLNFKLSEIIQDAREVIEQFGSNVYLLSYPCTKNDICTSYESTFPPGTYLIKAFGASGGGSSVSHRNEKDLSKCPENDGFFKDTNINCVTKATSTAGAGAFVAGILKLKNPTKLFFRLGGSGTSAGTSTQVTGGFNGGGDGIYSSGGGSTDVRAFEDTPFSRILVAGGGGAADSESGNDGIGGSAGGLTAQSFWADSKYQSSYEVNQTFGFSFFQGEAGISGKAQSCSKSGYQSGSVEGEKPGGGGGWFGGFSSHHFNGGAGGGSSFALTMDSVISNEEIPILGKNCVVTVQKRSYMFAESRPVFFEDVTMKRGAWEGNGRVEITVLSIDGESCRRRGERIQLLFLSLIGLLII